MTPCFESPGQSEPGAGPESSAIQIPESESTGLSEPGVSPRRLTVKVPLVHLRRIRVFPPVGQSSGNQVELRTPNQKD